jgi:hypothetical protein
MSMNLSVTVYPSLSAYLSVCFPAYLPVSTFLFIYLTLSFLLPIYLILVYLIMLAIAQLHSIE